MPGPNVLDLVGDIRAAVERLPRDQLVDILTYVFKEYVVEGPAPLAASPAAVQDDLAGMSFAEVLRSLQLRLDLPELELFEVQGDRVTVRIQGRAVPIELGAPRAAPAPPIPAAGAGSAPGATPATSAAARPAEPQRPVPAPPPAGATTAATPPSATGATATPGQPAPAAAPAQPSPGPGPRSGGLLEID